MFWKLGLAVLLLCALLTACSQPGSSAIELPDPQPDQMTAVQSEGPASPNAADAMDGGSDASDGTNSGDMGSETASESEDAPNSEDQQEIASSQTAAFSWDDMTFEGKPFLPIRPTTREELDAAFGEPIRVERIDAVNHTIFWEERQYDGILITCEEWDEADYAVGTVEYQRKDLSYVRGVHVGDSMEDVMGVFRNDATDFTPKDTDVGYGVVLYGTPRHMADYGILLYENGKPSQLMYQSQGGGVRLTLDDEGTVVSIEMFGGLH